MAPQEWRRQEGHGRPSAQRRHPSRHPCRHACPARPLGPQPAMWPHPVTHTCAHTHTRTCCSEGLAPPPPPASGGACCCCCCWRAAAAGLAAAACTVHTHAGEVESGGKIAPPPHTHTHPGHTYACGAVVNIPTGPGIGPYRAGQGGILTGALCGSFTHTPTHTTFRSHLLVATYSHHGISRPRHAASPPPAVAAPGPASAPGRPARCQLLAPQPQPGPLPRLLPHACGCPQSQGPAGSSSPRSSARTRPRQSGLRGSGVHICIHKNGCQGKAREGKGWAHLALPCLPGPVEGLMGGRCAASQVAPRRPGSPPPAPPHTHTHLRSTSPPGS